VKFLFILFITLFLSFSNTASLYAQKNELRTSVIFIKDLGAQDYYTLIQADSSLLKFKIVEACIPKGLLLIQYYQDHGLEYEMNHTQTIILKLTTKVATYTAYNIDQLRDMCSEYRKNLNDE